MLAIVYFGIKYRKTIELVSRNNVSLRYKLLYKMIKLAVHIFICKSALL